MTDDSSKSLGMRRDFTDRDDLIDYLKSEFPEASAYDDNVSSMRGGHDSAINKLSEIDPKNYAKTRNYVDGDVTYLSPYLRHGVLSLAEVRDYALNVVNHEGDAEKLLNELGWRDYFQRRYAQIGGSIWEDQENYKTGFVAEAYSDDLPDDIENGETGMVCVDSFRNQLHETGYLHNHARMWLAAYILHWRRVKWQAGARWFLKHLLDGDPASNNLSWQWVASTFSHKPYFFNRENLEKFSDGAYCEMCSLYGKCDFEGTYPEIEARLFPNRDPDEQVKYKNSKRPRKNVK